MALASPLLALPTMDGDRERVEAALLAAVRTRDAYLTELASHLIVAGGKRLRPVMTMAAAQVGGKAKVSDEVIQGAIACELVHLGSLYHDDVMDESTMRRGVDTVNAKWGNLQAIVETFCWHAHRASQHHWATKLRGCWRAQLPSCVRVRLKNCNTHIR